MYVHIETCFFNEISISISIKTDFSNILLRNRQK